MNNGSDQRPNFVYNAHLNDFNQGQKMTYRNRIAPLNAAAKFLALIVIVFSSSVIIGWLTDNEILKSVFPGFVAMNPTTALAFMLAGIATLLLKEEKLSMAKILGITAAVAVVLIGFFRIFGYLTLRDIKIDQILFHSKLGANVMAPNTAWNFLLLFVESGRQK